MTGTTVVETTSAAALRNVTKIFGERAAAVVALDDVSWEFARGSLTAVMGPSGSGKSTLLQTVAGLITPTRGEVALGAQRIEGLPERRLAVLRREQIGFVFQEFNLIPALTAAENITLPLRLARRPVDAQWFAELTQRAGIGDRLAHRPTSFPAGSSSEWLCVAP